MLKKRFGEILLEAGILNEAQLDEALRDQMAYGGRLGAILFEKGLLKDREYLVKLSGHLGIPAIDLTQITLKENVIRLIPREFAWDNMLIPFMLRTTKLGKTLMLAMTDPTDLDTIEKVERMTHYPVEPALAMESSIRYILLDFYDRLFGHGDYRLEKDVLQDASENIENYLYGTSDLKSPEPVKNNRGFSYSGDDEEEESPGTAPTKNQDAKPNLPALDIKLFLDFANAKLPLLALLKLLVEKKVIKESEYIEALQKLKDAWR